MNPNPAHSHNNNNTGTPPLFNERICMARSIHVHPVATEILMFKNCQRGTSVVPMLCARVSLQTPTCKITSFFWNLTLFLLPSSCCIEPSNVRAPHIQRSRDICSKPKSSFSGIVQIQKTHCSHHLQVPDEAHYASHCHQKRFLI